MSTEDDARASYDRPQLAEFWRRARAAVEAPGHRAGFSVPLPDWETRHQVAALLGRSVRKMTGSSTRVDLPALDEMLSGERYGYSLERVLELVHGRPVIRRESASTVAGRWRRRVADTLSAALDEHGLGDSAWLARWADYVYQRGRVPETELPELAGQAARILARLDLTGDPARERTSIVELAKLGERGAHSLDHGTTLARVVLRAAALAHGVPAPGSARDRRELWDRCGVTLDAVSATVLTFAIPWCGDDPWSATLRGRTALGLPAHLTMRDLDAAPGSLVAPGTVAHVCENPRVLDAVVAAGAPAPLVCVSGFPSTVARTLLARMTADGADVRYHGDFDPAGLRITRYVLQLTGGNAWRMAAADYRYAVRRADEAGIALTRLRDAVPETPWDAALRATMTEAGLAVEEEVVLAELLGDLTGEGAPGGVR